MNGTMHATKFKPSKLTTTSVASKRRNLNRNWSESNWLQRAFGANLISNKQPSKLHLIRLLLLLLLLLFPLHNTSSARRKKSKMCLNWPGLTSNCDIASCCAFASQIVYRRAKPIGPRLSLRFWRQTKATYRIEYQHWTYHFIHYPLISFTIIIKQFNSRWSGHIIIFIY